MGFQGLSPTSACVRRGRNAKKKVQRRGSWMPPPKDILKINTDGSSRGNPGPVGIGGVGRDCLGEVVFFFSCYKGWQANNFVEGLAIVYALERAYALGWRKIICESDSQVIVNLLIERKVKDVNWQLALVVQQIL
jgi:ribonuclease HI